MKPLGSNIKRYFSLKRVGIIFIAVLVIVLGSIGALEHLKRDVVINHDQEGQFVFKTFKNTVGEALEQAGVDVAPEDYLSLPLDSKLHKMTENEIHIKKAVPVYVEMDGHETKLMSFKETVAEVFADNTISLSEQDRLENVIPEGTDVQCISLDEKICENMKLKVVRVEVKEVNEQVPIPYEVVTRENNHLDQGVEKVARQGEEGIEEKTYKVVLEDGKETSKELLQQKILSSPISKIIELGTLMVHKTARGDILRCEKVLDMRATSYTASFKDTGKHPDHPQFGITYTGVRAKKGIIAVDPKVIPLGTKVYVEVAGNTPDYGYAVAADTGGAIKGNLIDLYFDDQQTVDNWGVKKVKVYILD